MNQQHYDIGSRNSAALSYLNKKVTQANTKIEKSSIWHLIKFIKCRIEYDFWKKQYNLACKDIDCEYNEIESFYT